MFSNMKKESGKESQGPLNEANSFERCEIQMIRSKWTNQMRANRKQANLLKTSEYLNLPITRINTPGPDQWPHR